MPELEAPPALLPLFGRAALTGRRHRGDTLPEAVYTLADQGVDRDHLTAYQKVCGFPLTDELPGTYLHTLAFPLSVALMSERAFPFPLVGLVHVENRIVVQRPVTASDRFDLAVRAADLRPHPAGRQFDVWAEARIGTEVVWLGRSTYLRRAGAPERARPPRAELPPQVGVVALARVPRDIGRRYGAVSGDRNPIHLYGLTARAFGFHTAIAHGMWLKARTLAGLQGRLPGAYTVAVAFKLPVPLPSTVAIGAVEDEGEWTLDVRNAQRTKPHLTGRVTAD